jgi:pimeloyl-ACP methyl ester carboxylesterase
LSPAHAEARADNPRFQVVAGSFTHSKVSAKINRAPLFTSQRTTGGDGYLIANRPSEGSRATRQALDDPSRENIAHYLRVHIGDENLVTDELLDYIHRAHNWSPEFIEARRQSVSVPHDCTRDLAGIRATVLLIHGRYDWKVAFELSIAILNHTADSRLVLLNNCGHWPPFEKPAEWAAQVLALPQGLLGGTVRGFGRRAPRRRWQVGSSSAIFTG